ncbi:glycosyltransferase [Rhodococcus chondri]|uniref:Glycosyltransferase n=1 Tax=Rhodococcus chondri TaxID=3065941 RepID=A0ABU7JNN8_9NOCA|nr:glycosyltransferase [Rhodococcus sp. CC-R104]MEE2031643.1 glycosyltransferase [Rhodococcus sp. CC-R104]
MSGIPSGHRVLADLRVPAPKIPSLRSFVQDLQSPLLRNGMLLTLSAVMSAAIGFGYWAIVARHYDAATVGTNSAAISMAMLTAAIAQLNLSSAMARFVPTAGRSTRRLVASAYLVTTSFAFVVAVAVVLVVPFVSPETSFLDNPATQVLFVVGTVGCTLFVLQDGVLTGLRRTALVPVENVAVAVVKIVMVVVFAAMVPATGIFLSWTASLLLSIPVLGVYLFLWAIPRHAAAAGEDESLPPLGQLSRFVTVDYIGAVCSIGAATLMPIVVLSQLGSVETAYFSIAWAIANTIHLVNVNLGMSLMVETAADQSELARKARQVMLHSARLVIPVVTGVLVFAPFVLSIFGAEYRAGSDVLRLMALAGIPNIIVATAISSARAHRRLKLLLSIQVTNIVLTLGLASVLLEPLGLAGAGAALLTSQSLIAAVLVLRRDLWLTVRPTTNRRPTSRRASVVRIVPGSAIRVAAAIRRSRAVDRIARPFGSTVPHRKDRKAQARVEGFAGISTLSEWSHVQPVPTDTDVDVAVLSRDLQCPTAVGKIARSESPAAELCAQQTVLAELHSDQRLRHWQPHLPRILSFRTEPGYTESVETFIPGSDLATALDSRTGYATAPVTAAITAIDEMHSVTGELVVVNDGALDTWVDKPLHALTDMCRTISPSYLPTVAELGSVLRRALHERVVMAGWTHGDFHPGNVRITDTGEISGIIDWGGARDDLPVILDDYFMLLTATCLVQHSEFGTVVRRRLRGGGLSERERGIRAAAYSAAPEVLRGEEPDERIMILLTWLHHVALLGRTCTAHHENRVWWVLNVVPVLRAFREVAHHLEGATEPAMSRHTEHPGTDTAPGLAHDGRGDRSEMAGIALSVAEEHHRPPGATLCASRSEQTIAASVVICAYTERRWEALSRAVESVRSQTHPAEEILVVIDHNEQLLALARNELRGVTVMPNLYEKGLSGARNTGATAATAEIVAFLDDDAAAEDDWLAALVDPYADPHVLGVGGLVVAEWATARPRWFPPEFDWVVGCSYRGLPTERARVRNMIGASMSLRRELVVDAGGFATGLGRIGTRPLGCEETELCIRLAENHPGGLHLHEPAARVRHSVPEERATWAYFRSRCYAEGLSKAAVSARTGNARALSSEQRYLTSTIPKGFARRLGEVARGRFWGLAAALAMVVGVTTTMTGYLVGRSTGLRRTDIPEPRERRMRALATLSYLGPLVATVLWAFSLPRIDIGAMGDYGLLPVLPITFWAALAVLLVSFGLTVRRPQTPTWLHASHVVVLIAILHATPSILYDTLRYSWAWKHIGIVDYFQRNAGIDTTFGELSAYQLWPAFFNANATLVENGGLDSALGYAAWAPPFFNVLLLGPLFLIFSTFTRDRRLIWAGITIFYLGSWVGQDYFAPQAVVFFLYTTVLALVLRYQRREVRPAVRRSVATFAIVPIMAGIVPTHQLTPLMMVGALGLLAVFRARKTVVLTALMLTMTLAWDILVAGDWLAADMAGLMSAFGDASANAGSGFIDLAAGSRSQVVVAQFDRALSAGVWALAAIGFARRIRTPRGFFRHPDLALPLLAVAPIPLVLGNDYGGEMIFRVYLLGLPFAAFYAAAAFFPNEEAGRIDRHSWKSRAGMIALPLTLVLLVTGFVFGYYGKEQTANFTTDEHAAARFVYGVAPRGSLIVGATNGFPWAFKNFEFYDHMWFSTFEVEDREDILADPEGIFADMMNPVDHHHSYLIITRSQQEDMELSGDLPADALPGIEATLEASPRFTLVYRNPDAVVFTLTQPRPEGS